jgi:tRNA U34 5-methylaminomethyl-2-thiouridine-forming methyltransferase MnmC
LGDIAVQVIIGDARATLPRWHGRADAWYLDGFSPAKNPELWGDDLMAEVGAHTAPGGTFATYTAAGHVRRALGAAGFAVERQPGFGTKRHMSTGVRT